MRMPTWSVTMAGSMLSGSAPLMNTKSARGRDFPQETSVNKKAATKAKRITRNASTAYRVFAAQR